MICEHCQGTGGQINKRGCWIPCASCGGTARGHCCKGMVGGPYEEAAQDATPLGTLQTRSVWASQPRGKDHVERVSQTDREYQMK